MKFITVLLAVLAVFSSVVLSEKVDPLASSSVVGTAKEEEVSPMVKNLDALSISPESTTQLIDQTTTPPLDSIADKRQLNVACKKFKRNGTLPQGGITGPEDYSADDEQTLQDWCESLDAGKKCCSTNGVVGVGQNRECRDWSTQLNTVYEVCENSCNGELACESVGRNTKDGSTITFESGSCSSTGYSCNLMAYSTTEKVNIRIGENSCTNGSSCNGMSFESTNLKELNIGRDSCTQTSSCQEMAAFATNLEELTIGENSCTQQQSCKEASINAQSLKQLYIDKGECSENCLKCGADSTFSEALKLTEECCNEETDEDFGKNIDAACQYSEPSSIPSSIPSTSNQPSNVPSSEPSWLDDMQCKKKDPENDICAELNGRCKIDCEDDENFVCVPGLCSYDRYWDKPTKSPKMRQLKEDEVEVVDFEITAEGGIERKLKATKAPSEKGTKATVAPSEKGTKASKAPKAPKAPKSSCACRVPRRGRCN